MAFFGTFTVMSFSHDEKTKMQKNKIENIFKMFKRVHQHVEGTGVGLFIVKRVIENYGGSITVKSELNQGSNFIITLPFQLEV